MTKLDFHRFQVRHFSDHFEQSPCYCKMGQRQRPVMCCLPDSNSLPRLEFSSYAENKVWCMFLASNTRGKNIAKKHQTHWTKMNTNKKIKRFLTKSEGCRDKKSATGPQCKLNKELAWNGNTIDLLTDHRSLHQWLLWLTIALLLVSCWLTPDMHWIEFSLYKIFYNQNIIYSHWCRDLWLLASPSCYHSKLVPCSNIVDQ